MKSIKIDTHTINVMRQLTSGLYYKHWLRENELKGNICNAAQYILNRSGSWNTAYNSFIEEHRSVLEKIAANPKMKVIVVRKTIEIYTVGFENKELIKMYKE